MGNRRRICILLCLVSSFIAAAEELPAIGKRKDIIRYGIESEIIELITKLQAEKEDGLNEDLLSVLTETHSPKLREALLKFFSAREWSGAKAVAIDIVDHRDQEITSSVLAALSYLAVVRATDGIPEAKEILMNQETKYMSAAVRLLGRAGGTAEAESLILLFKSDEATDALKQETILALGEIKAEAAVESLIQLVEDEASGKATRMYASDALGKIGDPRAIPALVKAANGDDPQVRIYAITALGSFPGNDAESAIVQGLRDSVPGVRLSAIKSSASLSIKAAAPYIRYRAQNDPDKKIRTESLKALGAYGGRVNINFLKDFLQNKKMDSGSRAAAFSVILEKDAEGSLDVLENAIANEIDLKDTTLLKAFLRELSLTNEKRAAPLIETYLLRSTDFTARIAGIDWVKKNKVSALKPIVAALAESDKVESVKKRATEALNDL